MPINFNSQNNVIFIETKNTVYAMKLLHDKFLVHLYYGEKGKFDSVAILCWVLSMIVFLFLKLIEQSHKITS